MRTGAPANTRILDAPTHGRVNWNLADQATPDSPGTAAFTRGCCANAGGSGLGGSAEQAGKPDRRLQAPAGTKPLR